MANNSVMARQTIILQNTPNITQDMFNSSNVIYEVRHNHTIQSQITIPSGCTLKFNGGSLSGGILNGTDTTLDAPNSVVFKGITIGGTWNIPTIRQEWFDFSQVENFDNSKNFRNLIALSDEIHQNEIIIGQGTWWTSKTKNLFVMKSNTTFKCSGTIKIITNNEQRGHLFIIGTLRYDGREVDNVSIIGGTYIGDLKTHIMSNPGNTTEFTDEHNHGICIHEGATNVTVSGVTICEMHGDGLDIVTGYHQASDNIRNIKFINCVCDDNGRQGLSIEGGQDILVSGCTFKNTGKSKHISPGAGIDFEPWTPAKIKNTIVENCIFENNAGCDILYMPMHAQESFHDENTIVRNCSFNSFSGPGDGNQLTIENCTLTKGVGQKDPEISFSQGYSKCFVKNLTNKFNLSIVNTDGISIEGCNIIRNDVNLNSKNLTYNKCTFEKLDFFSGEKNEFYPNNSMIKDSTIGTITFGASDGIVFDGCTVNKVNAIYENNRNNLFRNCTFNFNGGGSEFKQLSAEIDYYNCTFNMTNTRYLTNVNGTKLVKCKFNCIGDTYKTEAAIVVDGRNNTTGVVDKIEVNLIDNEFTNFGSLYMNTYESTITNVYSSKPIRLNEHTGVKNPIEGCWNDDYGYIKLFNKGNWIIVKERQY